MLHDPETVGEQLGGREGAGGGRARAERVSLEVMGCMTPRSRFANKFFGRRGLPT